MSAKGARSQRRNASRELLPLTQAGCHGKVTDETRNDSPDAEGGNEQRDQWTARDARNRTPSFEALVIVERRALKHLHGDRSSGRQRHRERSGHSRPTVQYSVAEPLRRQEEVQLSSRQGKAAAATTYNDGQHAKVTRRRPHLRNPGGLGDLIASEGLVLGRGSLGSLRKALDGGAGGHPAS